MSNSTLKGRVCGSDTIRRVMSLTYGSERRRHVRIYSPFPAVVDGLNEEGKTFRVSTVLDDISAGGLYMRLMERVREGAEVSVTVRLSAVTDRGMVVRLKGDVLRAERKPGGALGVAMRIEDRKIL
jgi:hypothetical protein